MAELLAEISPDFMAYAVWQSRIWLEERCTIALTLSLRNAAQSMCGQIVRSNEKETCKVIVGYNLRHFGNHRIYNFSVVVDNDVIELACSARPVELILGQRIFP